MTLTFYKALTFEKIVKVENIWDFGVRDDNYGNWVLDYTYFDDGIEQDISDSMILCDASDENPWTDLIMFKEDGESMEIKAPDNIIKMLSFAAEYALKDEEDVCLSCPYYNPEAPDCCTYAPEACYYDEEGI